MKTQKIYPVKCKAYFTGTKETRPPDLIFKSNFLWLDCGTNRYENKKYAHGIFKLFMSFRQDSGNFFSTLKKLSPDLEEKYSVFGQGARQLLPVIIVGTG